VNTLGTCGQTNFSDVPGTLVVAAATPTVNAATATATVSNTPNTSAAQGASVAPIAGLAVLLLGGAAVLIGRRRRIG
jgi:LPXTG-motif cell wall-anchored protein